MQFLKTKEIFVSIEIDKRFFLSFLHYKNNAIKILLKFKIQIICIKNNLERSHCQIF
jgi:hypothetical protein